MDTASQIIIADARSLPLPDECVQCCVTSPPYWGLRDYGTAKWIGGNESCDHRQQLGGEGFSSAKQNSSRGTQTIQYREECKKCGAVRQDLQLGQERTPEEYVANMVQVFREVKRVLKPDGTLWLNLGDSYAANRGYQVPDSKHVDVGNFRGMKACEVGLKPKDLVGIPWRVAFALQADGWYLRSDIIWAKPNPMPESVTDRPTKAHEYIFLLSKSEKYYFDRDAVAEPAVETSVKKFTDNGVDKQRGHSRRHAGFNGRYAEKLARDGVPTTRNIRTVWTIATQPYKGSHFATFPEDIPERCIKAGSRVGDLVLDPFGGSGTTAAVAQYLGRRYIHVDLNYRDLAEARIAAPTRLEKRRGGRPVHPLKPGYPTTADTVST